MTRGSLRVVVGGPPHSGKSTFTAALIEAIRDKKREQVYNISFTELTLDIEDNSLNALLYGEPEKLDVEWTAENVKQKREEFKSKTAELVIADAPGKVTEELEILLEPADGMILIINSNKRGKLNEWEEVAKKLNIEILFTITSLGPLSDGDLGWDENNVSSKQGTICSISRDDIDDAPIKPYDPTSRRMIRQIASEILSQLTD